LALGPGGSRRQGVHSYSKGAKISSQSPGQPEHSSLTRVVNGEVRQLESPSNRTKIDNCTPTEALHLRKDRLSCEEHMSQVDGNPFIPVRGYDFVYRMTIVVTCIVDEDADITQVNSDFFDGSLQRGNIADIAGNEPGCLPRLPSNLLDQSPACLVDPEVLFLKTAIIRPLEKQMLTSDFQNDLVEMTRPVIKRGATS